jgi:serine/threonine-protein kinase
VESDSVSEQGVRQGDIIAGKYRIERVLGAGGMGVVVAAHHIGLDEKVAIKFLLPDMLKSPEVVARFTREARAAVKIKSEHVARIHDVGTLDTGAPYMVMEYLEGGDLAAWIQQRGALPVEQAVEFVLQACVAVAEAHGLGIVHRDLKPANLFCVRRADGQLSIKVLDFGISKVTGALESSGVGVTRTTAMLGTPLYMSPEQMQSSKGADAQSDIWSLGVILFELLTGKVPFDGESVAELAVKTATQPPPSLRGFRPELAPELEAVVLRCLDRDRSRRYRNVAQLAVELLPFAPQRARASVERVSGIIQASGLSLGAVELPPAPRGANGEASAASLPAIGRTTTGSPGNKTAVVGGLLATIVGLAVVAGGAMLWRGRTQDDLTQAVGQRANQPVVRSSAAVDAASPSTTKDAAPLPLESQPMAQPSAVAAPQPASTIKAPAPVIHHASPVEKSTTPASPGQSPAAAPSPSSPAAAKTNCDPPYYYDDKKVRHYKQECL